MAQSEHEMRAGLAAAVGAYALWGVLPGYLKLLDSVDVREIIAQRILWTIPAVLVAAAAFGGGLIKTARDLGAGFAPKTFAALCLSSALIAANWMIFLWAVQADRVLESSLGYFLNPLVNVALGVAALNERLRPLQGVAIAAAGAGVALQAFALGQPPWVSLGLTITFAFYGLVRKRTAVSAAAGLLTETVILAAPAAGMLLWLGAQESLSFGATPSLTGLLIFSGPATAAPLMLFALAARRLRLSTLGAVQFLAPSIQFFIGLLNGEALTPLRAAGFGLIWIALAVFVYDVLRRDAHE